MMFRYYEIRITRLDIIWRRAEAAETIFSCVFWKCMQQWHKTSDTAVHKAKLRYRRTNNKHRPFNWRKFEIVSNNVNKGAYGLMYEIEIFIFSRNITHTRSALLWDITRRMVVIRYRRFGTTYRSHLPGSFWIYWSSKIETTFCSASNAHAPHCHLWSVPLYSIFPWYLIKDTTF